jgi:hypothetical protein
LAFVGLHPVIKAAVLLNSHFDFLLNFYSLS